MEIFLAEPNIGDKEREYVLDALDSGWINVSGKYVEKLEDELAAYVGASKAALTGSGTAGLMLALKALGIGPGDEVLVPTITFVASTNAVMYAGATPVFIDCDETLNIDPQKISSFLNKNYENNINKATGNTVKAIMPVHIFGNPCDMHSINGIAGHFGLDVIEDACEALGTTIDTGEHAGMASTVGVYSFSFNKMITTGNGGAVVSRDPRIVNKVKYLSTQAKDDPNNWIHGDVGFNFGLSNLLAALGCAQLERITEFLALKAKNFNIYSRELKSYSLIESYNGIPNRWFYAIRSIKSNQIRRELKKKGIQTRPLFYPNHMLDPYRGIQHGEMTFATNLWNEVVNLPCATTITEEEIVRVCDILEQVV